MNKRIGLVIAGVAAASVLAGGAAYGAVSSIPDSAGVIHGCYDSGGNMKVIDTSVTASCPKGYTSLNWNQTGLAGKNGKDGTNGTSATVNPLGTGDPNCASGGAAITDGTNTAYACNGTDGTDGTDGTNAAPEFTWTIPCTSGGCAAGVAQTSIPAGIELTPVAITVSAGTCSDPNPQNVLISDAGSHALASITWGAANSSTVDGPDTISAANGNVGVLHYIATGDCAFTITFTFDKTQSYS